MFTVIPSVRPSVRLSVGRSVNVCAFVGVCVDRKAFVIARECIVALKLYLLFVVVVVVHNGIVVRVRVRMRVYKVVFISVMSRERFQPLNKRFTGKMLAYAGTGTRSA